MPEFNGLYFGMKPPVPQIRLQFKGIISVYK